MDPSAFKYLSRDRIYPRNVHLNPFLGGETHPSPGIYGAAKGCPTFFVPITKPEYQLAKKTEAYPTLVQVDETIVPSTSISASSQLPQQTLINQVGFGNKDSDLSDSEIESNIDSNSLKTVPDTVLKAFSNPSMTVVSTAFKPKEKKLLSQSGSGSVVKKAYTKKVQNSKMKFI
jgi:hypothetical protein